MLGLTKDKRLLGRFAAYYILALIGGLSFIQGICAGIFALYELNFVKSMAEEDALTVSYKLIPHLKSTANHYSLSDLAHMQLSSAEAMADILSFVQKLFISAGLFLGISLACWLVLRWLFPDGKELIKADIFPGIPKSWRRPLKFR
jgi:hypothetical protein